MKKLVITAAVLACVASIVSAQTVTSANIVGYSKVDKPGGAELNIMGITFLSGDSTLESVCPVAQFSGSYLSSAEADQIITYTPAAGATPGFYTTYAFYDASGIGYPEKSGWKTLANFGFNDLVENPVVPAGSGLWIKSGSLTSSTNVILSGEVVADAAVTNSIVTGLQLVSNPFSDTVKLTSMSLTNNATGSYTTSSEADQVIVYTPAVGATPGFYTTYAFYDASGIGYPEKSGWKTLANFGFNELFTDVELQTGQGFWYNAQADFEWVETNRYLNAYN